MRARKKGSNSQIQQTNIQRKTEIIQKIFSKYNEEDLKNDSNLNKQRQEPKLANFLTSSLSDMGNGVVILYVRKARRGNKP